MKKYVKCYMGEYYKEIPIEDYLEIEAGKHGFGSYEELRKTGLKIELSDADIIEK